MEPNFKAEQLARAITRERHPARRLVAGLVHQPAPGEVPQGRQMDLPDTILAEAIKAAHGSDQPLCCTMPGPAAETAQARQEAGPPHRPHAMDQYELVSAGPDGKYDTADDVAIAMPHQWHNYGQDWWMEAATGSGTSRWPGTIAAIVHGRRPPDAPGERDAHGSRSAGPRRGLPGEELAEGRGGDERKRTRKRPLKPTTTVVRVRRGRRSGARARVLPRDDAVAAVDHHRRARPAELTLSFADSITTWRLTASASSKAARWAAPPCRCVSSRTSSSISTCR